MKHRNVRPCFCFILITLLSAISYAYADEQDVVLDVRQCDRNIIIEMQNAGTVAFSEEDVGESDFEEMMTTAYEFMLSGEKSGYFDPGDTISICDYIAARRITVLRKNE